MVYIVKIISTHLKNKVSLNLIYEWSSITPKSLYNLISLIFYTAFFILIRYGFSDNNVYPDSTI